MKILLLSCLGCLAIAGAAAAQTTLPDPRTNARVHAGPIHLTPTIAIRDFGIDTNVFNNGEGRRDFTFTLAPRVDTFLPIARRAMLTTSVGTGIVYYQRVSTERSVNPQVTLRGDVVFNRISMFAEPSYLKSRERLNFEVDARARRKEHGLVAGATFRIRPKLAVDMSLRQSAVEFDRGEVFNGTSLQETLNRETRLMSATVRHQLTPLTLVSLVVDRAQDRFALSPLRNADSVRVAPAIEMKAPALIAGRASVGIRRFTPLSAQLAPFTGIVASAALNYSLNGATRVTATVDRDVTYSYERDQPYFVVTGLGLAVRRQLVGHTDLTLGAQRQRYTYRNLILPGAAASGLTRVDAGYTWTANMGYRIGQTTRLGWGAAFRQRSSNHSGSADYQGLRLITTIDYGS